MQEVGEYYKDLAVNAVKALGMEFGGVDIITTDITQQTKCGINEINYNPGLRLHYKVNDGEVVKVAIPIMEYIRDKYINS
jgi:D-alanine-D-alanine ligase-like ATP-grasp enzyme